MIYFLINAKTLIATGTKVSGFNIEQYISFESVVYLEMMFAGLGILISFLFLTSHLEVNAPQFKYNNNRSEGLITQYDKPESGGGKFILVCLFICLAIIGWAVISTNNKQKVEGKIMQTIDSDSSQKIKNSSLPIHLLTTNKTFSPTAIDLFKINSSSELMDQFGKENVKKQKAVGYEGEDLGYEYVIFPKTNKEVFFFFSGDRLDYITFVKKNSF